jgi:Tfp pilus assembly protein PilF
MSTINSLCYASDIYKPEIPKSVANRVAQFRVLRDCGKSKQIINELESITKEYPDYYRAHYSLALAYANIKDYKNAIREYEESLAIRRKQGIKEATIFNSIGITYINTGDYVNAEKMLKEGEANIELLSDRSIGKLYNSMGVLYLYTGNVEDSRRYFNLAITKFNSKTAQSNAQLLVNIQNNVEKSRTGK